MVIIYGIIRALNRIIVGIFIFVINDTIRQHNSITSYDIISALNSIIVSISRVYYGFKTLFVKNDFIRVQNNNTLPYMTYVKRS